MSTTVGCASRSASRWLRWRAAVLALVVLSSGCGRESGPQPLSGDGAPGAGEGSGSPRSMAAGAVVLREHALRDPGLNGMVASVLLVPEGWVVEGGLSRPSDRLYNMPVVADVKVLAPDGRAVRFFPSLSFEFDASSQGQPMQPTLGGNLYLQVPESPGQWLMQMAERNPDPTVSDLRLVAQADVPELTTALRAQAQALARIVEQGNATTAAMGFSQAFDTQATRLVLQYRQHGRELEETLVIAWEYLVMLRAGQPRSGTWAIKSMRSLAGPVGSGYLEDPVLSAIVQSVRADPAWEAEMQRYWAELARIRQKGASDRQASWQAHQQRMQQIRQERHDIINRGYHDRAAAQARGHERVIDAIREERAYATPAGETVKLPGFYDHVYTDGQGRYLLNNDGRYDPNVDPALNRQRWERIEPQR